MRRDVTADRTSAPHRVTTPSVARSVRTQSTYRRTTASARRRPSHSSATRTRVLTVVAALAAILLLAMFAKGRLDAQRFTELVKAARADREQSFSRLLELRSDSLASFVRDYTPWDDMVEFAQAQTEEFSRENLEPAIDSFHLTSIRVFDRAGKQIFVTQRGAAERNPGDAGEVDAATGSGVLPTVSTNAAACAGFAPVDAERLKSLIASGERFWRFFGATDCGPIEVVGATIHTTSDHDRRGEWYGTLFATRIWDDALIADLSRLSGFEISYRPGEWAARVQRDLQADENDTIAFLHPIVGLNGGVIGALDVRMPARAVSVFRDTLTSSVFVLMAFVCLLLVGLIAVLGREVTRPLGMIAEALREDSMAPIERLALRPTEFGDVARTLENFFAQRGSLTEERQARQTAEAELGAAREASTTASRARTEMLDTFAREAQRAIAAFGQTGQRLIATGLAPAQLHIARTLRDHHDTLSRLVSSLEDVTHLDRDTGAVDARPFDPRDLIEEALDLLAVRAQSSGVELCAEVSRDMPARIVADAARIQQTVAPLFEHLLRNASRGELVLHATLADEHDDEAILVLALRFESSSAEEQSRFPAATSESDESTGAASVSLDIARRLATRLGGTVAISTPRRGDASLTLRLPVKRIRNDPSVEAGRAQGLRNRRVLVIEPAVATRRAIVAQLEAFGARADEAANVEGGLALLRDAHALDEPFDALLAERDIWLDAWRALGDALAPGVDAHAWPVVVLRPFAGEEGSVDPNRPSPGTVRKPVHRAQLHDRLASAIGAKPPAGRRTSSASERTVPAPRDESTRLR